MAINANGAFNSALSLFCSLFLDMAPTDLPEGLSPDNQDVWFFPGSVQTRPALQRLIASIGTQTIMSMKEFPLPNGNVQSVFLDSQGNMRTRDVLSGGLALLSTVTPGVSFKAENAFQKQWYAFYSQASAFSENPFVGVDVPRYYDGKSVWRVTQDAPGATPGVNDYQPTVAISATGGSVQLAAANAIAAGPGGATETGNVVTITTSGAHGFTPGEQALVQGVSVPGYNGVQTVQTVPSTTTFTYTLAATGLAGAGGGSCGPNIGVCVCAANHGLSIGDTVVITGSSSNLNNGTATTPASWIVVGIQSLVSFYFSMAGFTDTSVTAGANGQIQVGGKSTPGTGTAVVLFKLANGEITGPSLPVAFTSIGNTQARVTSLPIGPTGTVQRIVAFTPKAGTDYFYLTPATVPAPSLNGINPFIFIATSTTGTIVPDNTSTSAVFDFSDTELLAGTPIGPNNAPSNNLFNQIVLAPCLGVSAYTNSGRLCWWGEINNLKNFLNMGFDGGYIGALASRPLGWSAVALTGGTGVMVNNPISANLGFAYQMTSAGTTNDAGIQQSAYQDYYGAPIIQPNTSYIFRCQAMAVGTKTGNLVAELFSATGGSLGKAQIAVSGMSGSLNWLNAAFSLTTPAVIPSDTVLRIYLASVNNGTVVTIDELEIIDSSKPVLAQQMRVSYFDNPFGYDVLTGVLGIDTTAPITGSFTQRGYLYILTDESVFQTQNNGQTEPDEWTVAEFSKACGCCGPNAVDAAEGVAFWAGKYGHRIFYGDTPKKISQEIQPVWDTINWNAQLNLWLTNDPVQRIIYIGLPTGSFNAPNLIYPVSYRSVNVSYEVPDPLHISYSGKMICSDLSRKTTRWNVTANCGAMMTTDFALPRQMVFGVGNAQAPGMGSSFGQLYTLNQAKYTDDDFGVIASYYVTYAHWVHDVEQNIPLLGLHRKIYTYLSAYITGIGNIQITPLVDSLSNAWNPTLQYELSQNLTHDLEWGLNVTGDRAFFKIAVTPLPGTTDAFFNMGHMVVAGRMDKNFPVRGAFL